MSPGDESLLVELTSLEEWLVEANATLDSEKRAPRDMAQFDRCLKKHQVSSFTLHFNDKSVLEVTGRQICSL